MNDESNLVDLTQRREKNRINNEAAIAKQEGYVVGYEKAKRRYTGLVWALSLYGVVMTVVFLTRIV